MRIFVVFFFFLISNISYAASETVKKDFSYAVGAGIFLNHPEIKKNEETSAFQEKYSFTLNGGTRIMFYMSENLAFRSGLYLQEKSAMFSTDWLLTHSLLSGNFTFKVISASIPVNLQYRVSRYLSIFGGYSADFKINEYCVSNDSSNSCSLLQNAKSVVHNANVGLSVWGSEKLDVDVSYQYGLSDFMNNIKVHSFLAQMFYKI